MKHIKRIEDWLVESANLDRLIELGLVKPESLTRIQFRISRDTVRVIWEKIREGKSHQPDSVIKKLTIGYWAVLEPGETEYDPTDSSQRDKGSMPIPGNLTLEDIVNRARRLAEHEFIDFVKFIDEACCEWLKTAVEEKGAFDSHGVQMIVSGLTGQTLTIDSPKRITESGLDRLAQLGMVDPKRSNRIEYVSNRAVLADVHERIVAGYVPAKEMRYPFFYVYGYDKTGAPTNSQAGTDVLGRNFLTGSDFSKLIGLRDFEVFLNRVETLFINWLRAQPDEYFQEKFGFESRPLFARDETAALLGFTEWTPLKESQSDGLSKLLKRGLIDPISQPRVEYEVSRWFLDYVTNLIPGVSSTRIWKDDVRSAIIGRVKIYEPGNTEVARWVSLVGLDLFDGPEDIDQIREQELDRDGLRELAGERILGVIKRGFSTNWRTSSSPDPDAEDAGMPTLIKRADQREWSRFSLNESNEIMSNAIRLFKLGFNNPVSYIAYEINEERLANLQSEFLDPRANEPAFRKHLIYNVLAESFSWWEHRLPEEAGKGDPNLKLSAVIDGDYWLDEGSIQLRMLMRDGDELDFNVPFEEFLQEIKHRILEYLSGERAPLDPKYKPLYILDKGTGVKYSVKTGESM